MAVGSFEFAPSVAEKLPNRFLLGSIASENGEAATADTDGKWQCLLLFLGYK